MKTSRFLTYLVSIQKFAIFRKIKPPARSAYAPGGEIKEFRIPPLGREQEIPQIDTEIAEKGYFWMETI